MTAPSRGVPAPADDARALIEEVRGQHQRLHGAVWCGCCHGIWPCLTSRLADALEAAQKDTKDAERVAFIIDQIHGSGESLVLGGACSWSLALKHGRYGKERTVGNGDNFREAVDDWRESLVSRAEPDTEEEGQ